jgi:hypothetical protein
MRKKKSMHCVKAKANNCPPWLLFGLCGQCSAVVYNARQQDLCPVVVWCLKVAGLHGERGRVAVMAQLHIVLLCEYATQQLGRPTTVTWQPRHSYDVAVPQWT